MLVGTAANNPIGGLSRMIAGPWAGRSMTKRGPSRYATNTPPARPPACPQLSILGETRSMTTLVASESTKKNSQLFETRPRFFFCVTVEKNGQRAGQAKDGA